MPDNRVVKYEGTFGEYVATLIETGTGLVIFTNKENGQSLTVPLLLVTGVHENFVERSRFAVDPRDWVGVKGG